VYTSALGTKLVAIVSYRWCGGCGARYLCVPTSGRVKCLAKKCFSASRVADNADLREHGIWGAVLEWACTEKGKNRYKIRLEKIQSTAWDSEHAGGKCASDGYWEEAAAGMLYRHPFPAQCWRLGRLAAEIVGGECD
jgi:hypothetical protein